MGQTITEKIRKYWRKKKGKSMPQQEEHLGVLQKIIHRIFNK